MGVNLILFRGGQRGAQPYLGAAQSLLVTEPYKGGGDQYK